MPKATTTDKTESARPQVSGNRKMWNVSATMPADRTDGFVGAAQIWDIHKKRSVTTSQCVSILLGQYTVEQADKIVAAATKKDRAKKRAELEAQIAALGDDD